MKKPHKKAAADTKMLMEAGLMVLGGIVVLVLLALLVNITGTWGSNKDMERTNNNFANLVNGIEDETLPEVYPIFIDKKHMVVGFGERPVVNLDCTNPVVSTFEPTAAQLLRKPASCQQQSCICLCEHDGPNPQENENIWDYELGDYACNPAYGSVDCRIIEDTTFEGATFASGGHCDFAFIGGKNENQNIYITKKNNAIGICAEDCTLGPAQSEPVQEEPEPALVNTESSEPSNPILGIDLAVVGDSNSVSGAYQSYLMQQCPSFSITYNDDIPETSTGYQEGDKYAFVGKRTDQQLEDLSHVLTQGHDTIIFFGFANNAYMGPTRIQSHYEEMFVQAKEAGATVIAVTSTPHGQYSEWFDEPQNNDYLESVNYWLLSQTENVDAVVDVFSALEDPSNLGHMNPLYMRDPSDPSDSHTNSQGQQVIGETIFAEAFGNECPALV